jgi:predicted tellurium resistance membrane protein TerC
MEIFLQPESWLALLTLTLLEIVLGVDNIIFISIVTNKLPQRQQEKARITGLALALIFRVALLFGISYMVHLTSPLFTLGNFEFSWRDLILSLGGLFLITKSTSEINHKMEDGGHVKTTTSYPSFNKTILQIILLDIIFSFDSILTAVGLTDVLILMITAVVLSMIVMMAFAGKVANIINKHPSLEILALSFLILIGFMLILDALHYHVPKGYIYFAVFYSLFVQLLNIRVRKSKARKTAMNQQIEP